MRPSAAVAGACLACGRSAVAELLDLGHQPLSNRFLRHPEEKEYTHPLALGQCAGCGLIQTVTPVSARELAPRFSWITYSEPEGHLDKLVRLLTALPGLAPQAVVVGISFKDDSTLARFRREGWNRTWRLDPGADLGIDVPGAGVETIQDRLTTEAARAIAARRGLADILVVRHILEHAFVPREFMAALRPLLRPGGYLVVEVPDCERALRSRDYTTVWEEHALYFTRETFRQCLALGGFDIVAFESYPYPFEDSLVVVAQPRPAAVPALSPTDALAGERERWEGFVRSFPERRDRTRRLLAEWQRQRGKMALFGAGHLAGTWINLLGVGEYLEFVVDDNPHKRGLFMPGSHLPIRESAALVEDDVKVCLLSVNPLGEDRLIERNREFARAGAFFSIFPTSPRALPV